MLPAFGDAFHRHRSQHPSSLAAGIVAGFLDPRPYLFYCLLPYLPLLLLEDRADELDAPRGKETEYRKG